MQQDPGAIAVRLIKKEANILAVRNIYNLKIMLIHTSVADRTFD